MLEFETKPGFVKVNVRGKLTGEEYDQFFPEVAELAEHPGSLRLYVDLEDLDGWEPEALWRNVKRHEDDVERIAVVGEGPIERWATKLSKPFFEVDLRFFARERADEARNWLTREV